MSIIKHDWPDNLFADRSQKKSEWEKKLLDMLVTERMDCLHWRTFKQDNKAKTKDERYVTTLTWKMPVTVIYVLMKGNQNGHFDICRYARVILCRGNSDHQRNLKEHIRGKQIRIWHSLDRINKCKLGELMTGVTIWWNNGLTTSKICISNSSQHQGVTTTL